MCLLLVIGLLIIIYSLLHHDIYWSLKALRLRLYYCRSFVCGAIWWVVKLGLFICTSISYECSSLISWFNRQSIKLFNGLLGLFKISQHYNRWTSYYCTYISMWCYFMMHNKYLCVAILYSRIFSFHEIHTFIGP